MNPTVALPSTCCWISSSSGGRRLLCHLCCDPRLCLVAAKSRPSSTTRRDCRCARTDRHDRSHRNRSTHRHRDDRSLLGRHQGTRHAAAAVVGLSRSTPPSSGRSATSSSIRRGRLLIGLHARRAQLLHHAPSCRPILPICAQCAAKKAAQARHRVARARSRAIRRCSRLRARSARPRSATTAQPAMAPVQPAPRAIPISTMTTGCGVASSSRSSRPSSTGCARATSRRMKAAMLAFGRDGILKSDEIVTVANYRAVAVRSAVKQGRCSLDAGKKLFADNCASCHGDRRQGQPGTRRAEPDRQDLALRLRRGDADRDHHQRPRRRDADLGRPA